MTLGTGGGAKVEIEGVPVGRKKRDKTKKQEPKKKASVRRAMVKRGGKTVEVSRPARETR